MSFDNFVSSGDSFDDFDKYFNFGSKFSASTVRPDSGTFSPGLESTRPWRKNYNSDKRSWTDNDGGPKQDKTRQKYKRIANKKQINPQSRYQELHQLKKDKMKYPASKDQSSNVWTGGFEEFHTYLDQSQFSQNDWYPWDYRNEKKNKMEPIEIVPVRNKSKQNRNTNTPKPSKVLNLNSLDKATVYRICKKTKSADVTNLCKEYSLTNEREVKRQVLKKRKQKIKEKKHLKRRKTKQTVKQSDSPKTKKHLFFEANSFRRRKSERSRSLLDQLASVTRLIWPGPGGRGPEVSSSSGQKMSKRKYSKKRGWQGEARNNNPGWFWQ